MQLQINNLLTYINGISQAGVTFLGQLPDDAQALTNGAAALGPAISEMEDNYKEAVLQYSGIGGEGILQVLENIYSTALGSLEDIQNTIASALTAEQPVASALSQFQGIFVTLASDYTSAIEAVQNAAGDSFASGLLAFDIPDAQAFWKQASSFAQQAGL